MLLFPIKWIENSVAPRPEMMEWSLSFSSDVSDWIIQFSEGCKILLPFKINLQGGEQEDNFQHILQSLRPPVL